MPNGEPASVAQPSTPNQLLIQKLSNSNNIINKENKLILYNNSSNFFLEPAHLKELLTHHQSIMDKRGRRKVYFYFLDNIAATGALIMAEAGLSEQGSYSHMKWLHQNGFIEAQGKIRSLKKGGPRPVLYSLPGASKEQIARTILKIRKSRTKSYRLVLELVQLIWEDINDMQIQMSKIISLSKRRSSGFHFMDVANLVARELKEKGVAIWKTG